MSIVDRVQKLIALSASENENESRNAASAACKLIREHKLTLSAPAAYSDVPVTPNQAPDWTRYAAQDIFEELLRAQYRAHTAARKCAGCDTIWAVTEAVDGQAYCFLCAEQLRTAR